MSLGAVSLMIIFTFLYPVTEQHGMAIGELQLNQAVSKNIVESQENKLQNLSNGQEKIINKLTDITIILCIESNTSSICP